MNNSLKLHVTMKSVAVLVTLYFATSLSYAKQDCIRRYYKNEDSFVCVCNSTYCDFVENVGSIQNGHYLMYSTSKDGLRMERSVHKFEANSPEKSAGFTIDPDTTYQTVSGFGGSFTDSTGFNILSLSPATQENLIKSYFSPDGIEYSLCRVPIGCADFSTQPYSHNDNVDDFEMEKFSIAKQEQSFKIPIIKAAQRVSGDRHIRLFASPWSSPGWMKTSGSIQNPGPIKGPVDGPYFKAWAKYFVRFLESYQEIGFTFWAISVQNEASICFSPQLKFPCVSFYPDTEGQFITKSLIPAMMNSSLQQNPLIFIMDDNMYLLPEWVDMTMSVEGISKMVAGVATHWYMNYLDLYWRLDETMKRHPQLQFVSTEACLFMKDPNKVSYGDWEGAQKYADDIILSQLHGIGGWIDWNMVLNHFGKPNWVGFGAEAAIIVNQTADEFYKQPTFYAMGHFSKFVPPGSVRIKMDVNVTSKISGVGFSTPNDHIVVIILNSGTEEEPITIYCADGNNIEEVLPPKSLHTLIWERDSKK